MAYTGNTPTTQSFISGTDVFAVSTPTTVFTLSRPTTSISDIEVWVGSTALPPTSGSYSVSDTTLTLVSSVSSGNVYVRYLSTTTQQISPTTGSVGLQQLSATGTANSTTFLSSNGAGLVWSNVDISTADISGVLPIANGGTASATQQGALNNLSGSLSGTSGQYLRSDGSNVSLTAIAVADVPLLNQNTTGTASNVTGVVAIANGGTGATTATNGKIGLMVITSATGSEILPSGTTAQRDGTPQAGYIRFNTDLPGFEGYNGSAWGSIGAGAKGGGNNQVFFENDTNVTASYTITTGKNAMSAGPITVDSGVTVTIPDGSTWSII